MLENINEIMITCEKHPSQMITHICCLDTCLSPLCVNCMKNHNSYHKKENVFPEIEALEDVREFCCEKLFYLIENYNKELDKIKFVSSPKKPDPNLKKLLFYRDKIISFINAYFSELEKEYEKKNRPITDEAYSISNLLEYFRKMIKNLEDYLQEVKYNCSLETIQNILVADFQQDFELMKAKSQELSHNFSSQKTILLFDDEKIHHIFQEVEKITTFNTYHNNNDLIKSTPHSNKLIFETMRIPVISPIENSIITTHNTKSFTSY